MRQADRFDRLLHLGNVVVDIVVTVPALPERGGDVLASRAAAAAGGGFNVMAAAARQGLRAAYAGAHGTGPFGTLARAALAEEGIEVIQPAKAGLDTGFVLTMVEAGGERTFLTSRGAEATLTAADLDRVSPAARDVIYVSGYGLVHDSNRAALLGWLARLGGGQVVFFDPGPLVGSIPAGALAAVLGRADWLACNAREAAILTGSADPQAAAAELARRAGPAGRPRVLVRTGPGGCLIGRRGRGRARVRGGRGRHQRRGRRPQRRVHRRAGGRRGRHRRRPQRERGGSALGHPARAGHGANPGGTRPVSRHRLSPPGPAVRNHERFSSATPTAKRVMAGAGAATSLGAAWQHYARARTAAVS